MLEPEFTYAGACSGIGIFEHACEQLGGRALWHCEKDEYCQRVLAKRFPDVPIIDDIHKINSMPASKLTNDEFLAAIEKYKDGSSIADIADHLPITRQALHSRFQRAGVEMRPRERYGSDNHFYRGGPKGADWAHNKVERAINDGSLIRPLVCELCGESGVQYKDGRASIQGHHDDYNKPLEVRWFCKKCHHQWHCDNEPIPLNEEVIKQEACVESPDVLVAGFP